MLIIGVVWTQGTFNMIGQGGAVCIWRRIASAPESLGTGGGAKGDGLGLAASSTMVPFGSLRAIQGSFLQRLRSAWVRFAKFSAPQDKASPIAFKTSAGVWGMGRSGLGGGTTITGAVVILGAVAFGTTGWIIRMGGD